MKKIIKVCLVFIGLFLLSFFSKEVFISLGAIIAEFAIPIIGTCLFMVFNNASGIDENSARLEKLEAKLEAIEEDVFSEIDERLEDLEAVNKGET